MDLGTIQYNVEANTAGIDKANESVNGMEKTMQEAGVAADQLGKKTTAAGQSAGSSAKEYDKATESLSGISKKTGQASVQLQQFVGQLQSGQSVFVAFSQQAADLGIVLGAPLIGAVIGISASLAGMLIPSLKDSGDALKDISDLTKELSKDFKDFTEAQKLVVNKGVTFTLQEEIKALEKKKDEIWDLNDSLDEQAKSYAKIGGSKQKFWDNERASAADKAKLVQLGLEQVKIEQHIKELQDPTGSSKKARQLSDEADLVNKSGKAYWELKAAQEGVAVQYREQYISAGLRLDQQKEEKKATEDSKRASEEAAKKAIADAERLKAASNNYQIALDLKLAASREELDQNSALTEGQKLLIAQDQMLAQGKITLTASQLKLNQAKFDEIDANSKRLKQEKEEQDFANYLNEQQDQNIETHKKLIDSVDEFGGAWTRTGSIVVDAFGTMADALDDYSARMTAIGKKEAELAKDKERFIGDPVKLKEISAAEEKMADERTRANLDGYAKIAGASASLFKEQSKGRKALNNLEKTLTTIEIALSLKKAAAKATEAIASAFAAPFPINFASGAAMIAIMAGLGLSSGGGGAKSFKETQATQNTGTVLGSTGAKSDSIEKALSSLDSTAKDTLDVNHSMYQALLDIKTGISGVASSFAKTIGAGDLSSSIKTGTSSKKINLLSGSFGEAGGFVDSIFNSISSFVSNKSKKVTDSGIRVVGSSLADILATGAIEAFNYADVQTTKKVLGMTTSKKVRTQEQALNDTFEKQFADVFSGAGSALEQASKAFGIAFDPAKLIVDSTKLSLKGLEGDALTKEIEGFFSNTLDKWAGVITSGTGVLEKYQQIGEGAFETVVRLATETNTFTQYAKDLNIKFGLMGLSAVDAVENISKAAGGFDTLTSSLGNYYKNFFSDSERTAAGLTKVGEQLKTIGIETVPKTREAFRALIEDPKIDLATDAGQKYFATLINLSGAFAQLVPATKEATATIIDSSAALKAAADERASLEKQYFDLTATQQEKRSAQLSSLLSDEARATQQQIYNYQDAQAAADAASKAISDMAAEQEKIASERINLEGQLLQIQGNTAELRSRELSLLDPSNRALQEQIYALQDMKSAADASAEALSIANAALKTNAQNSYVLIQKSIDNEKSRINQIVEGATKAKSALDAAVNNEKDNAQKLHEQRIENIKAQADAEKAANDAIAKAKVESLQDQKSAIADSIKATQSLIDGINGTISDMAVQSNALTMSRRRAAQFEVETALRNARSGRGLPDVTSFSSTLDILKTNAADIYSSSVEYAQQTAITQNQLKAISDIAGTKLSSDEMMLNKLDAQITIAQNTQSIISSSFDNQIAAENAAYEKQISALDKITANAQSQYDVLTGIDTKTLSVSDALDKFNSSLLDADFTNAQQQIAKLDEISANAKLQIDALNGIDNNVLTLNDSFIQFANAINAASQTSQAAQLAALKALVDEVAAMRSDSAIYNDAIAKNTASTAANTKSIYKDGVSIIA